LPRVGDRGEPDPLVFPRQEVTDERFLALARVDVPESGGSVVANDLPLLVLDRGELRGAPARFVQVAVVPHVPADRLRAGAIALRARVPDLRVLRLALLRNLRDPPGPVTSGALARWASEHRGDARLHVAARLADVGRQRRPTPILVREVRREPVLDS